MKLVQQVRHASSKWVKGDLRIFQHNVGRLSLFRRNIFPFSYVELFGYDKSANKGTVMFHCLTTHDSHQSGIDAPFQCSKDSTLLAESCDLASVIVLPTDEKSFSD